MKKFILNIFAFSLLVMVMAYPLDWLLSRIYAKSVWPVDEILVTNDIKAGRINVDVAVYGSSRAWRHFNPDIMMDSLQRSVFNFGIDGHNFWMQYYRHKLYFRYNNKPKVIIHSVDATCFERRKDLVFLEQFLPFMLFDTELYEHVKEYEGFTWADFYLPLYRYMGRTKVFEAMENVLYKPWRNQPMRKNGYNGSDQFWNDDFAHAKANNEFMEAQLHKPSLDLYEEFLQECKDLGIEVIMVYSPKHIDGQNFIKNNQAMIDTIAFYAQKHQVPFLDYSKDSLCYNTAYFYNAMHLNAQGANLFTAKLMHDLKTKFPHLVKNNQ